MSFDSLDGLAYELLSESKTNSFLLSDNMSVACENGNSSLMSCFENQAQLDSLVDDPEFL